MGRSLKPHALAAILQDFAFAVAAQIGSAGIARHEFQSRKNDDRNQRKGDEGAAKSLCDQPQHGASAPVSYSARSTSCQRM